jgi:hypothetical protein
MMGMGEAAGEQRAIAAAEEAIVNPLLDEVTLKGAKSLLLCITGGRDMTLWEVEEAASRVCQEVDPEANIIVGATFDDGLGDRIRVSIVASGMPRPAELPEPARDADQQPVWTPRSQREAAGDPYGRRMAETGSGDDGYGAPRPATRGRGGKGKRPPAGEGDARERSMAMAGDGDSAERDADGLSSLPKTPGRGRKGAGSGRRPGEAGPKRPSTLPDGVELGDTRRRPAARRPNGDGHPPPVNWRELTAPEHREEHDPPSPPPPVNWRELSTHANGSSRSAGPEFDGTIVPEREPEAPPRKLGFFERLGFGRKRA